MIVAILNQKGGAGKTTLCTNLARSFYTANDTGCYGNAFGTVYTGPSKSILVIDADPQGSARDWGAVCPDNPITVIGMDRPTLNKDINAIKSNFSHIFIDGAPQLVDMSISAIKAADIVLIPVQPSPYDIWASADLVEIIKERQKITNGLPKTAFVISRQIVNTNLGKEIREALNEYDLPIFTHGTYQRVIYPESAALGKTVVDISPASEAAKEINLIAQELKEFAQCQF